MSRLKDKKQHNFRRSNRVRTIVRGTKVRPRMSVFISNRTISVQIIDDESGTTLASANSVGLKGTMTEQATQVGAKIAQGAKAKKIKKVALDRGPKLYHGRIKALAESARKEGLEF